MPSCAATRQVFLGQEVFTAFPIISSRRLLCRKIVDSRPVAFQGCFQSVSRETATCVSLWLRVRGQECPLLLYYTICIRRDILCFCSSIKFAERLSWATLSKTMFPDPFFFIPLLTSVFPNLLLGGHYAKNVFVYCLFFP